MLVGLDWAKPMMFLLLHVTCSCIPFFYLSDIKCVGTFLFLSLSLSLSVSCSMAPKWKSTLSQNPLCSEVSSSSLSADTTPSHVRFYDDKSRKDFSKNFSQCSIHLERQVVLSDFPILTLPLSSTVGVGSLCVSSQSIVPL